MRLFVLLTLVFSVFAFGGSKAPEEGPSAYWQQSESLNIQLGVRDKNALAGSYVAVFTVQNKEMEIVLEAKITVAKDDWGFVYFPNDFPPGAKDGDYLWKCTVSGKTVSSGSFKYAENQRTLTIPLK